MTQKIQFIPLEYEAFDHDGKNFIKIIGRNQDNEKICVVDSYSPNFYLILEDSASPEEITKQVQSKTVEKNSRTTKILKTKILDKKFLGNPVKAIQVFASNHKDLHDLATEIGDIKGIKARREYDIKLITKYIKENKVEPLTWYEIEPEENEVLEKLESLEVEKTYFIKSIKKSDDQKEFTPKILSYDIETTSREVGEGEILMISMSNGKDKKVLTWKKVKDYPDYVETFKDEADMIEGFAQQVRASDADILTGYFSDGFDLPFLKARANHHKVKLDLGLDKRDPVFTRGRFPSGKISGLIHVDLYRFIEAVFSQYLQSETLSLNEVASELVGSSKEDFDFAKLSNMKEQDWKDFFSYSLQDAAVTHELAKKIWPDIKEFCHVVKEPIFEVTRSRMASHVENHIIHNLDRFEEIAEKRPNNEDIGKRRANPAFMGANVFQPTPGFYKDMTMFDFTSMHASLIVTFNISGQSLRLEDNGNCHKAPEFEVNKQPKQVYFDKTPGFFSKLLSEVVDMRKKFKKEYASDKSPMKKARSNAYKLLANATFGYQGFFGARYYSYEAAAATLAYVRKTNEDAMKAISAEGFKVIYGDTDSIAFLNNNKSKQQIKEFLKSYNKNLPGIMELDLEDFFSCGLFVAKRGSKEGAKKKYALMSESGKIKIRGFETVRRDWCRLSRNLQDKVLRKILQDQNEEGALKLVKKTIEKLQSRNIELEDLVIKTKMKRNVDDYVAQGPHVAAAKKMIQAGEKVKVGTFVEYFIGEGSGKKVGDRVFLRGERVKYDVDYYLNKQLIPAIENIFEVFNVDIKAILEGETQETLF
jgi:DNA polymerase I